jgi:hypothetical protein
VFLDVLRRSHTLSPRIETQDEAWKAANCRRCPHCGRPVNKLSGCDAMHCGQDSEGGNVQPGCGKGFRWSSAHPYAADVGVQVAREFTEAAPDRAVEDVIIGRTLSGRPIRMVCDMCSEECGEIAFQCINCPAEVTVCLRCMPMLTQGGHDGTHIFRIIGEWKAPGAAALDPAGGGPAVVTVL